jgi:hypothetical protein
MDPPMQPYKRQRLCDLGLCDPRRLSGASAAAPGIAGPRDLRSASRIGTLCCRSEQQVKLVALP